MAEPLMEVLAFVTVCCFYLALVWSAWARDMVGVSALFVALALLLMRRDLSIVAGIGVLLFWLVWSIWHLVGGA